jgi:hypothetical protein
MIVLIDVCEIMGQVAVQLMHWMEKASFQRLGRQHFVRAIQTRSIVFG